MGQETWNGLRAAMLERRFSTSGDSARKKPRIVEGFSLIRGFADTHFSSGQGGR